MVKNTPSKETMQKLPYKLLELKKLQSTIQRKKCINEQNSPKQSSLQREYFSLGAGL